MNIERIQSAAISPRSSAGTTPATTPPVRTERNPVASDRVAEPNSSSPVQGDKANLEHAVKRLSDYVSTTQAQINFSIDETSGIRVVKIIDSQSKDVIRQIPSEEAIQLANVLDKLQGLLVKDQA